LKLFSTRWRAAFLFALISLQEKVEFLIVKIDNPKMAIKGKKNYPLSLFFVKKVNFHLFSAVFHV